MLEYKYKYLLLGSPLSFYSFAIRTAYRGILEHLRGI